MGCQNSILGANPTKSVCKDHGGCEYGNSDQLGFSLSEPQKTIIRDTWGLLKKEDLTSCGMYVFLLIFTSRPEVKNLFSFRDVAGDDLLNHPHFRAHACHFVQAIGTAVDHMDDLDSHMSPLLLELGEQHAGKNGFGIEYFETFTHALMTVWEEQLEEHFTAEVRAVWERMFLFIMMTLRQSYQNAKDVQINARDIRRSFTRKPTSVG